ncbi:MAG: xanthine dehydrogenase small subunit, partial [Gammaproteobacteria bacterium]|nr:xanthine dehydrogenase small subunit [Gammaproteobacteria bacterium]
MMAVALDREDDSVKFARIAYGGMADTPARSPAAEAALRERGLNDAGIQAACDAVAEQFQPLSDVRASADYRRAMAAALLDIALREIRGEGSACVWSAEDAEGLADHG